MQDKQIEFINLRKKCLEKYYSRMNPMQKQAVFSVEGPILILAGAGSGKTTVLINRIENMIRFGDAYSKESVAYVVSDHDINLLKAYLDGEDTDMQELCAVIAENTVKPWNILAITFTNKAADELKKRLFEKLGEPGSDVAASTFHSMCVRILRREIEVLGYKRNFTIYDSDDSLRVIKDGLKAINLDEKVMPPRSVLSAISKAKDSLLTPEAMLNQNQNDFRAKSVAKVYQYYQNALKNANALDFDDIIVLCVQIFANHPQILQYYQNRYKYIMVDEYQDTNQTQYRLVSMLAKNHNNICVVGDDDQSIYKFRGATIENILSFESQFDKAKVIRLEQNYRSTQNILSAANAVISNNTERKGKNLWTDAGEGDKIRYIKTRDEREEAKLIADEIIEMVENGGKWSDNALLYRMNAQSNSVERALAQRSIPYRIVGGVRFYDRKEIKDITAYLSVVNNTTDTLRLLRIINEPKRGIGNSTLLAAQEIADMTGETLFNVILRADEYAPLSKKSASLMEFARMILYFAEVAEQSDLGDFLDEVFEKTGYIRMLELQGTEGLTRIENIMELKTNIVKYALENPDDATLSGFLEEIALYSDIDNYDKDVDTVTLMTVHSSKGLEFKNVFIVGMEEGIFPGKAAINYPDELEEERRLAYVAVTRAKEQLTITGAERRMIFGQTIWCRPSRFVGEVPKELVNTYSTIKPPEQKEKKPAPPRVSETAKSIGVGSAPKSSKPSEKVAMGDTVRHSVFGTGKVVSTKSMGGDTLVEIAFDNGQTKKVMENFAKLKKI